MSSSELEYPFKFQANDAVTITDFVGVFQGSVVTSFEDDAGATLYVVKVDDGQGYYEILERSELELRL